MRLYEIFQYKGLSPMFSLILVEISFLFTVPLQCLQLKHCSRMFLCENIKDIFNKILLL